MPTISDIMHSEVVTLSPDTTLGDAITLLCEHSISGAPVVSDEGKLVGVISEFALMDVLFDPNLKNAKVSQYMTPEVHCLTEDDTLTEAVHMFAIYGVRRLPVVRNGKLIGIVSRRDLMQYSLKLKKPLAAPLQEFMPELSSVKTFMPEEEFYPVDFA